MKKQIDVSTWVLWGVRVLFYVVAIAMIVFVVIAKVKRGQITTDASTNKDEIACDERTDDVLRQGFEVANMNTGRAFVLGNGDVYYWPKTSVSGLGEKSEQLIPGGNLAGIETETRFSGYKIATKDVVSAVQLGFGLRYSGENLIMIHENGTVTWLSIYNGKTKMTEMTGYQDIVSAAPSINGDGVPVITLISRNGKQNHLLLKDLNALMAK